VGYLTSRRITRRLEHLATTVADIDPERMSADWTPAAGNDEVGVVAAGLEAMTGRLRAFIERERSFTRDASHELRTPLAVIRSAGDQLSHQPDLSELSRQHANLILESTDRLEQTVATLLALAREQHAGGADNVQLLPLIEQVVIDQAPRLEDKPVEVIVDVAADALLRAPPSVARIVLANLVGNAFAHTTRGVVRIDTHEGRLRIVNPGAPDSAVQSGCAPGVMPSAGEGFGFGLGIVRRLCGQFGLEFELRAEDGTVTATLPLAGAQPHSVTG
jgi:signal transduction histidine kinase